VGTSRKTLVWYGVCLIAGMVIGYFVACVKYGRSVANAAGLFEFTYTAGVEDQAFQAYLHQSPPVAIYAMNQALKQMKDMEDSSGETPYESRRIMATDEMFIHGRLAKLYLAVGQTNLSELQVTNALQCAWESGPPWRQAITNEAVLMEVVAKIDNEGK
jgi:hypothetical protein